MKRFIFVLVLIAFIVGIFVMFVSRNKNDKLLSPIPVEDDVKVIIVTPKN